MTLRKGDGTADVLVEGRGANLSLPLPLQKNTVTVQLVKNPRSGPECWGHEFSAPFTQSDATRFADEEWSPDYAGHRARRKERWGA